MPDATPGDLYQQHQDLIEWAIGFVCRKHGFHRDEAEDFGGQVRLHFLDPKAQVLRKFKGRSKPQTYICTVVNNKAIDFQIARRGRWRASKVARSGGSAAILLEEKHIRDGLPFDQALALVLQVLPDEDAGRLTALAARFPPHARRQVFNDEDILNDLAAGQPNPEELVIEGEGERRQQQLEKRLAQAAATLDDRDRLLLQLHFQQGMTIADIARLWKVDQKQLYRQLERVLKQLRTILSSEGRER